MDVETPTVPVATKRISGRMRKQSMGERCNRRFFDDPELTDEDMDFCRAIEAWKRKHGRPFPTWSDVLAVVKAIGYRRVAESQELP